MVASFGHLHGYSALYYTYMWSLAICKDLIASFGDDLMDTERARSYRRSVLEPGGARDARELVSEFLGRETTTEAFEALLAIPSIKRIRIHSRMPVTLPMRIDAPLLDLLSTVRPLHLVTHFNHPREMTVEARAAIDGLLGAGVVLANQAVLLAGVNDDLAIQTALWRQLVDWGVRPYYLHHPDLTVGTQHFRVSLDQGLALSRALRGAVSGLFQPTYVIDIPGGLGKVPVDSGYVEPNGPGRWWLTSPIDGRRRDYRDPGFEPPALG